MNRETLLAQAPLVKLFRFDHPAGEPHEDPPQEVSRSFSVAFLDSGAYEARIGRRPFALGPGMVFVTRPGRVYRSRHPGGAPSMEGPRGRSSFLTRLRRPQGTVDHSPGPVRHRWPVTRGG